MSTTEELFAEMESDPEQFAEKADPQYCVLEKDTSRILNVPERFSFIGVENDKRAERLKFRFPRIVGNGLDLSKATIKINFRNADRYKDQNKTENITIDGDYITFEWVPEERVTKYKGTTFFLVYAYWIDQDGAITNKWHTALAKSDVYEGLEVTLTPGEEEDVREILTQLVADASEQIEKKAEETLKTIPDDYVQLQRNVNYISDDVDDAICFYPENLFNPEDAVIGKYMSGSVGSAPAEKENAAFSYIIIPVKSGKTYTVTGTSYTCYKLDANKNILQSMSNSSSNVDNFQFTVQEGASYVLINFRPASYPIDTYMVVEGDSLPDEYIEYGWRMFAFNGEQYYLSTKAFNEYKDLLDTEINKISEIAEGAKFESSEALEKINDSIYTFPENLFNPEDAVMGKYMSGSVGSAPVEKVNAAFAYIKIPVESGTYTVSGTSFTCYKLNPEGNISQAFSNANADVSNYNVTIQDGVTELLINFKIKSFPVETYMIVNGTSLPEEYIPFGETINSFAGKQYYATLANLEEAKEEMKTGGAVYTVGTGGDYSTFTECIRDLKYDDSDKTIYVLGGTYDIFEEIGGADFTSSLSAASANDWRNYNDVIPPNTQVIGVGNVIFSFEPTADEINENASYILSPINISGSCTLENITVNADNCRYCIHDETSGDTTYTGAKKKYKNVKCIKKRTGNRGYEQAYAAGFDDRMQFEFENCVFESESGIAFSMHNRDTASEYDSSSIIASGCAFVSDSGDTSLRFGNINWRQEHIKATMIGCYFNKNVKIDNESGYGNKNAYDLTFIRCSDVDVTIVPETNIYPVSKFN